MARRISTASPCPSTRFADLSVSYFRFVQIRGGRHHNLICFSVGNVIWYINSNSYSNCSSFNDPIFTPSNTTNPCTVSEACVIVAATFFCSQYCGKAQNGSLPLPPCQDSCDKYKDCLEEYPCLPTLTSLGLPDCVEDWVSSMYDSANHCTFLGVNIARFSDGKEGRSQAGSGSRASEHSIPFQTIRTAVWILEAAAHTLRGYF